MVVKVLSVAEKPSVAKELAAIISHNSAGRRAGFSVYNHVFDVQHCLFRDQGVQMAITSVSGHMMELEFDAAYKGWNSCNPIDLFAAPLSKTVKKESLEIQRTLVRESKDADILLLWLDCDLEGENIAFEVARVCAEANPRLDVFRARFSALIERDILRALKHPERPNAHMNDAVDARQEIDLRIGAAFTRFQTIRLRRKFENLSAASVISYGPCQFPTLGFVVERDLRIAAFAPAAFWTIALDCEADDPDTDTPAGGKALVPFHWERGRVYDRLSCLLLFELCAEDRTPAVVTHAKERPTTRSRPLPMNTIDFQILASRCLRMGSDRAMAVAEALYQRGLMSYPRTETNAFAEGYELAALVAEHRQHSQWGAHAAALTDEGRFQWPRRGTKDDQAHPPIHPTKAVEPAQLESDDERAVYELVCRHFLAACSPDAAGKQSTVTVQLPGPGSGTDGGHGEVFSAHGLIVTDRGYLDVYGKYDHWTATKLPKVAVGDALRPARLSMREGATCPPEALSEAELIGLMDRNGIGTDATIASHIATIQARDYATKDAANRFRPTKLGLALVEGYNAMGYQLNRPQLRAAIEADCAAVARGDMRRCEAVQRCLDTMRTCFATCVKEASKLDAAVAKHFVPLGGGAAASYAVLDANLSACGVCHEGMQLRQQQNTLQGVQGQGEERFLFCLTCRASHPLPAKGVLSQHELSCALCGFQALTVTNQDTQREHTICPHCYSRPPGPPEGTDGGGSGDFRCFSCAHSTCPLALRTAGGDTAIAPCADVRCAGQYQLRRTSKGMLRLTCNGGTCKASSWWMPGFVRTAVPAEGCSAKGCEGVLRLRCTIALAKAPPGASPVMDLCPLCAPLWVQAQHTPLPRRCTQPTAAAGAPPRAPPSSSAAPPRTPSVVADAYGAALLGRRAAPPATSSSSSRHPAAPPAASAEEVQAPVCRCADPLPCRPLTVSKEGANKGRRFFSCSACGFFQWADEPSAPNPAPHPRGGAPRVSTEVRCRCEEPARVLTVSKDGPNKGRHFLGCALKRMGDEASGCGFFEWMDGDAPAGTGGGVGGRGQQGRGGGGGGGGPAVAGATTQADSICSRCRQPGHYARTCPNK